MRITEFHKPITAQALNESAEKTFGQKLNLESFSMEQLEDARNKLRTKLYQFENTEGFNAVHENDSDSFTFSDGVDIKGAVETVSVASTYSLGGGKFLLECIECKN